MEWVKLLIGPLLPVLEDLGKWVSAYFLKRSYIKQGRNEVIQANDEKELHDAKDAQVLKSGIDSMSDDELHQLLGYPHKPQQPKE
jgi:hypothetical protein